MKPILILSAAGLSLALAACGESQTSTQERAGSTAESAAAAGGEAYSGSGDVTAVSGDGVTISHGPIKGINWPAMTMTFRAGSPEMLRGINVGDPVTFSFRESGGQATLASIAKANP